MIFENIRPERKNTVQAFPKALFCQLTIVNKSKAILKWIFLIHIMFLASHQVRAQAILDLSVGSSFQDNFNSQLAIRNQFGSKFQAGFEFQYGIPKYRFIETRELRDGYTLAITLPGALQIQNDENIQLYVVGRLGMRFQGDNESGDSSRSSSAILYEVGLLTTFRVFENVQMQSGISLPSAYEISPSEISEYTWSKLHLGASSKLNGLTLFVHTNIGAAFGASGDTYKYIWSAEAGVRIPFGELKNSAFKLIHPSF